MPRLLSLATTACTVVALAVWVLWPSAQVGEGALVDEQRATLKAPSQAAEVNRELGDRKPEREAVQQDRIMLDIESYDPANWSETQRQTGRFFSGPRSKLAFDFEYEMDVQRDAFPRVSLDRNKSSRKLPYAAPGFGSRRFRPLMSRPLSARHQKTSRDEGRHELCIEWERANVFWYSRQMVDLISGETVHAAPVVFNESQKLSIVVEQGERSREFGKLDQDSCNVTLYGPIRPDGTVEFATIDKQVKLGKPFQLVGMQAGRWAVEVGPIENEIDGKRYGSNHTSTIYEFDWNGQHQFRHQIKADLDLKDVQLKLVRTYPDRPAAVPRISYSITPIEAPEKAFQGSMNLLRTQASATQGVRLQPGRYQFAIVPENASRWGGGYCGTREFEVKDSGDVCEVLVVAEARAQLTAQQLDGRPVGNFSVEGQILSIGPTPLLHPIRFKQSVGRSGSCKISNLPVGSTLLIDVSDETVVINKDREVVLTFSDEQLREMGVAVKD